MSKHMPKIVKIHAGFYEVRIDADSVASFCGPDAEANARIFIAAPETYELLNQLRRDLTLVDARLDVEQALSKGGEIYTLAAVHQNIKDDLAEVERLIAKAKVKP